MLLNFRARLCPRGRCYRGSHFRRGLAELLNKLCCARLHKFMVSSCVVHFSSVIGSSKGEVTFRHFFANHTPLKDLGADLLASLQTTGCDIEVQGRMRYWWVNQNQTHRQELDGG
jgi:hypothetical protein